MYQTTGSVALPVALPLEEGGLLGGAQLAWSAYGERSDDNVAVLLHDLPHSHRALGPVEQAAFQPSGWGTELVGEGRPLDTSTLHVVVPNLLGSPFGSTSPVTVDARAGLPYGAALPTVTVTDMARAVAAMLRGMKVRHVRALVGVGLGGLVALRLAALFPELPAAVVVLGAARTLPEAQRERLGLARHLLRLDPDFHEGQYTPGHGPKRTLRKQYLEYLRLVHGPAEPALEAEADAFAEGFDANTWALLCTAYAGGDVTDSLAQVRAPVLLVAAAEDALAPPSRVRDTYHLLSAAGVRAHYHELPAPSAHASLLTQVRRLHGPMRDFLRRRS
ncbi:homoserine O-acetyltransferase [Archangium gephyra]|uniref:Homoserine O-acetyltransferase n=1 Tax=Archangium gephyra TaxID=48 RepID=A0AAC8QC15_9BACT|nr:alpha/beta fold hydrolase [Archangium gephyra]AKJ04433.1 Homoserine O-acetyltransferase [Archangium gephyra]REG37491.1 homoserine O-acetyltransferase [Archangium gephyra]